MPNVPPARPRRLQAQPSLASRYAVHASARPLITRALAELPQEVSVEALTAAYDAWLEGTVATTIRDGVATIPVRGVLTKSFSWWNYWLGWSAYDQLAHDLDVALQSPDVGAILLSIDSPGGQVDGLAELADRIVAARDVEKPIVAHVDGMAASAAYWIASAAPRVVLAPTAMAGSIGVVMSFTDWSGLEEQLGIRSTEIVATQSPKKRPDPFEADGRAQLQVHVDALAEVFLAAVAAQRRTTRDVVAAQFGQGDVFVGQSAVDAGLADALGSYETTHRELVAQITDVITLQFTRTMAAEHPARVVSALSAAVAAATHPQEESMAAPKPQTRPSAADPVEEDDPATPPTPPDPEQDTEVETTPQAPATDPTDEEDAGAAALEASRGTVVARIRAQAATAERARIASIRALGRPGQEPLLQACIDDPACTVEKAALALLQHEQGQRAAHLRGVRAEEAQLDAPDNRAAPEPSGDAANVRAITSIYLAHRRPKAEGATQPAGRA